METTSRRHPGHIAARLLAAGMLIGAIAASDYSYFLVLRWVVFGVAGFECFTLAQKKRYGWLWLFFLIVLLFNPLVPMRMAREAWQWFDLFAAVLFLSMLPLSERTWSALKQWAVRERLAVALSILLSMLLVLAFAALQAQSNRKALAAAEASAQKIGVALQPSDSALDVLAATLAHPTETQALRAARALPQTFGDCLSSFGFWRIVAVIFLTFPAYIVVAALRPHLSKWHARQKSIASQQGG
jgi:hypothetical protein